MVICANRLRSGGGCGRLTQNEKKYRGSRETTLSIFGIQKFPYRGSKSFRSALRCVGYERVIRIAGIHKIGTRGAQHFFDLLDRSPNYAARLAGLNLAL
jgi:hypothetical protein